MNNQKIRSLIAIAAFASLGAPFAAYADAPSGDLEQSFPLTNARQAQFPVRIDRDYNSSLDYTFPYVMHSAEAKAATRAQVLKELATMPAERIGA